MKDSVKLLVAGLVCACLAWVFWHYAGEYGFIVIIIIALAGLASRSARLRKEQDPKR